MYLQLFHTHPGEREGYLEIALMGAEHVQKGVESRHIRALRYIADAPLILKIIIIIVVCANIKEAVTLEMYDLVYLKV